MWTPGAFANAYLYRSRCSLSSKSSPVSLGGGLQKQRWIFDVDRIRICLRVSMFLLNSPIILRVFVGFFSYHFCGSWFLIILLYLCKGGCFHKKPMCGWLVISAHFENISQIGSFPQFSGWNLKKNELPPPRLLSAKPFLLLLLHARVPCQVAFVRTLLLTIDVRKKTLRNVWLIWFIHHWNT